MILAPRGRIPGSFPHEIVSTQGGNLTHLCPHDPYYYQRGEAGYYHDTQLGQTVPTDAELSSQWSYYTPWNYGWVNAHSAEGRQVYWPNSWIPPHGLSPAGPPAPVSLGDATEDALFEQKAHNRRMFQLSMIGTIAVATSALIAIFRTSALMREESKRRGGSPAE